NHGIFEKRECCEYLIINKASNDILRIDYNKLLSDEEEEKQEEKENSQNDTIIHNDKYDSNNNKNNDKYDNNHNIHNIHNNNNNLYEHLAVNHIKVTQNEDKNHDNKEIILNIPCNYKGDEIPPSSFLNDDILLEKDILNYDDICDLGYSIQNEIHSTFNKNIETNNSNINIHDNKSWFRDDISYNNSFDKDNSNFLCDMNIPIKEDKENISICLNHDTNNYNKKEDIGEINLTKITTNKMFSDQNKICVLKNDSLPSLSNIKKKKIEKKKNILN
ncbi:hypothetical protein PFTANZ_06490, partial [Plasmodium falciparum Tanzania (2000708)]